MAVLTPMMLKPTKVEDVFIVGLGGGLSTGLITGFPEVKSVEVAEISKGVVNSLPFFEAFNHGLKARMDKVTLTVGDAYRILFQRQKKYDLIVSEPSNTWVSGVEKLFTKEFYEAGRGRLNSDGMFVQWFPLFSMQPESFLLILKTFQEVFPNTMVFAAQSGALTLIGTNAPFDLDRQLARQRYLQMEKSYTEFGVESPEVVWMRQLLGPLQVRILTRDIPSSHSLFNTSLEYSSGRAFFAEIETKIHTLLSEKVLMPVPEVANEFLIDLDRSWINSSAILGGWKTRSSMWAQLETFILVRYSKLKIKIAEMKDLEPEVQRIRYLLGPTAGPLVITEGKDFEALTFTFRRLVTVMEKPYFSRLFKLLDACTGPGCIDRKRSIVRYLTPADISQKTPFMDEATLDLTLGKIKAAYKNLGYDPGL